MRNVVHSTGCCMLHATRVTTLPAYQQAILAPVIAGPTQQRKCPGCCCSRPWTADEQWAACPQEGESACSAAVGLETASASGAEARLRHGRRQGSRTACAPGRALAPAVALAGRVLLASVPSSTARGAKAASVADALAGVGAVGAVGAAGAVGAELCVPPRCPCTLGLGALTWSAICSRFSRAASLKS